MPASIQIQGKLLNTSINSILDQTTRLGNLSSNSAVYIKQSFNLNANQSASTNLVSWIIFLFKNTFHIWHLKNNISLLVIKKN